jgi:hypothetical protein
VKILHGCFFLSKVKLYVWHLFHFFMRCPSFISYLGFSFFSALRMFSMVHVVHILALWSIIMGTQWPKDQLLGINSLQSILSTLLLGVPKGVLHTVSELPCPYCLASSVYLCLAPTCPYLLSGHNTGKLHCCHQGQEILWQSHLFLLGQENSGTHPINSTRHTLKYKNFPDFLERECALFYNFPSSVTP